MSGVKDRPWVSSESNVLKPTQPFVKCFINNVEVFALIDTGSMRTFISNNIHDIIDFDRKLIDTSVAERCVSITGGSLNILGHLCGNVKFMKSEKAYMGRFLVSDNISYDCVLGWDFLQQNKLSLNGDLTSWNSPYYLTGSHGRTKVILSSLPRGDLVTGVTEVSGVPAEGSPETRAEDNSTLLVQSSMKADIPVVLDESVVVPARTEIILEGKLVSSAKSEIGMISPLNNSKISNDVHVANTVVHPTGGVFFCE